MKNKFDEYFNESMTSIEIQGMFFSLCDACTDEEKELLLAAYEPVFEKVMEKEIKDALENGIMS
jgi:hypothetical protein